VSEEDEEASVDPEAEAAALRRETVARRYALLFVATLHRNNGYFAQYVFCELLNLAADLSAIYSTDVFLGGRFLRYGARVLAFYRHPHDVRRHMPNPMCTAFPTVTR